jgi:tetratricopeptide (TPR) repeat protein
LNPTSAEAYDRLGWTYHTNGESTRAIDALEQGVGVDPVYDRAWGHLGLVYYTRQNFETAIEYLPKAIELAEGKFLRRVRQVEINAEVQTLTGPEFVPVLRGRFNISDSANKLAYEADLRPISFEADLVLDADSEEPTCWVSVVQSIENRPIRLGPGETLDVTQVYSRAFGTAMLDFTTGNLMLDIENMPRPETSPYEITVRFWPNRVDNVGFVQPDGNQQIRTSIQFEEKLSAPVEYYYTLGLAYAYLDPPQCDQAVPWLLTALEIDSGGYNPAWAGLRICPSSESPPTPIPTFTPLPEQEQ